MHLNADAKSKGPLSRLLRTLRLHTFRLMDRSEMRVHGVRVNTAKDAIPKSVRSSVFKGTYEEFELELVLENVRAGDKVLEIGTGIGLVSLVSTRLAGEGNVLSYEANPTLQTTITDNYARNNWTPNLRMKAVTTDGGDLSFYQNDNIVSSSTIDRELDQNKITVQSDPINDVIAEHKPAVLVMDVEGAEIDLLTKADLSGIRAIIVEMHPHIVGDEPTNAVIEHVEKAGFIAKTSRHKTILFIRKG